MSDVIARTSCPFIFCRIYNISIVAGLLGIFYGSFFLLLSASLLMTDIIRLFIAAKLFILSFICFRYYRPQITHVRKQIFFLIPSVVHQFFYSSPFTPTSGPLCKVLHWVMHLSTLFSLQMLSAWTWSTSLSINWDCISSKSVCCSFGLLCLPQMILTNQFLAVFDHYMSCWFVEILWYRLLQLQLKIAE